MSHGNKLPVKISWRDQLAWAACNWIMNHVATEWYRVLIGAAIRHGLTTATIEYAKEYKDGQE